VLSELERRPAGTHTKPLGIVFDKLRKDINDVVPGIRFANLLNTSMSVHLIVRPKCTLAASHGESC